MKRYAAVAVAAFVLGATLAGIPVGAKNGELRRQVQNLEHRFGRLTEKVERIDTRTQHTITEGGFRCPRGEIVMQDETPAPTEYLWERRYWATDDLSGHWSTTSAWSESLDTAPSIARPDDWDFWDGPAYYTGQSRGGDFISCFPEGTVIESKRKDHKG